MIHRTTLLAAAVAALLSITLPAQAQAQTATAPNALIPVSVARNGFTPEQARTLRDRYSYTEVISAGDVSLFHFLNMGIWLPTAIVARQGDVAVPQVANEPRFAQARLPGRAGDMTLSQYLRSPGSRAQGMVILHRGRIVFEDYPGMRATDSHVWMSTAKTTASLVVRLLVEEGKIDVHQPIERYMPALQGSEWAGTRVIDVLDMASGMDIVETQRNRENQRSVITRFNLAVTGDPNADGKREGQFELIRNARRMRAAGQSFDYSSINTIVLALLAEAVENKRWSDIFQERVWGKLRAEGDLQVAIAPDSTPQAHGLLASRLRDLGRYGLLYTPSWSTVARERIVSPAYIRDIQTGGRKDIFAKGEIGEALATVHFPGNVPSANSWQWDAVWDDGDFYKGGVYGQGLYVSPKKDLVMVWFSTVMSTDLPNFARQIAKTFPAPR